MDEPDPIAELSEFSSQGASPTQWARGRFPQETRV
jgi:hypothetical protein